jgi:hypothetical protein
MWRLAYSLYAASEALLRFAPALFQSVADNFFQLEAENQERIADLLLQLSMQAGRLPLAPSSLQACQVPPLPSCLTDPLSG